MEDEEKKEVEEFKKKQYVEKIDFESLVFIHINRLNEMAIVCKDTEYFVGVDQLTDLCLGYGNEKLNSDINQIDEEFTKKIPEAKKRDYTLRNLKLITSDKKFRSVMRFLARDGLSGRRKTKDKA